MLRKSLLFVIASLGLFPLASAQYVPVTGSHIQDLSGAPLASGQICFQPTNNSGALISFKAGSGGQTLPSKKCVPVVQGAFLISLADSTLTYPQNVCYRTTVVVPASPRPNIYQIASCLQPSETITSANSAWCTTSGCNLDDYPPNLAPLVVVQTGTPGPAGPAGTDGITQLTGDVTATGPGSAASTLATVNSSPGTCGDATHVCQVTTNGKGLTTVQTAVPITMGGSGGALPSCASGQMLYYSATGTTAVCLNVGTNLSITTGTLNATGGGGGGTVFCTPNAQTGTAYTLALTDGTETGSACIGTVTMTNAAINTVTVPPNSSVALPTPDEIDLIQLGTGQTCFAAGAGVTLNVTTSLCARAQNSTIGIRQISANTWIVFGDTQ